MLKFIIIISDFLSGQSVYSSLFRMDFGLLAVIKDDYTSILCIDQDLCYFKRSCIRNSPPETSFDIIVNCMGNNFTGCNRIQNI